MFITGSFGKWRAVFAPAEEFPDGGGADFQDGAGDVSDADLEDGPMKALDEPVVEGRIPTRHDATEEDVADAMKLDEPGLEDGPPKMPAAEDEQVPAQQRAPQKPAPKPVEQVFAEAIQQVQERSDRNLSEALKALNNQQNQLWGGMIQQAQQRQQRAAYEASIPKDPGPQASPEEVLNYRLAKTEFDHKQQLAPLQRTVNDLQTTLQSFVQQQQQAQVNQQNMNWLDNEVASLAANQETAFVANPVVQNMMFAAIAAERRIGNNTYGPRQFAQQFSQMMGALKQMPASPRQGQARVLQLKRAAQQNLPAPPSPLRNAAGGPGADSSGPREKNYNFFFGNNRNRSTG